MSKRTPIDLVVKLVLFVSDDCVYQWEPSDFPIRIASGVMTWIEFYHAVTTEAEEMGLALTVVTADQNCPSTKTIQ